MLTCTCCASPAFVQSYPISNEVLAAVEIAVFAVLETKRYQAYSKGAAPGEVRMAQ